MCVCVQHFLDCNPTHLWGCFNTIMKMSWSPVTSTRMIPKPELTMCSTTLCVSLRRSLPRVEHRDARLIGIRCIEADKNIQSTSASRKGRIIDTLLASSGTGWLITINPSLSVPGCVNIITKALVSCQVISSRELIRPKDRNQVGRGWSAPHEWSENIWRSLPSKTLWIYLKLGKTTHILQCLSRVNDGLCRHVRRTDRCENYKATLAKASRLFVFLSCRAWLQSLGSANRTAQRHSALRHKSRSSETILACPLVEGKENVSCLEQK